VDRVILSVFVFDIGVPEDYFRNVMITRREFLLTAPLLGRAAFSFPAGSDKLADLIRTAPRARYWASSATSRCLKELRPHTTTSA
jgi:hypothetical protein